MAQGGCTLHAHSLPSSCHMPGNVHQAPELWYVLLFFAGIIVYIFCIFLLYAFTILSFYFLANTKNRLLHFKKCNCVFVFLYCWKIPPKKVVFLVLLRIQMFSLELRAGKTHQQTFLTTSETWSGYPTTTIGCSKRQRNQLPILRISMRIKWQTYVNIACSFAF